MGQVSVLGVNCLNIQVCNTPEESQMGKMEKYVVWGIAVGLVVYYVIAFILYT